MSLGIFLKNCENWVELIIFWMKCQRNFEIIFRNLEEIMKKKNWKVLKELRENFSVARKSMKIKVI